MSPETDPAIDAPSATSPGGEMPLLAHLVELRSRLIKCVVAVVVAAVLVGIFQTPIFEFLSEPYCNLRPENDCSFLVTDPLGEFNVLITLAGYGGVILAMPIILYQIARFVLPGLYPAEKRAVAPFVLGSVVLLFLGLLVGYVFLPRALEVLTSIGSDRFENQFTPNNYLKFFVKMVLAFGLAFELPLILVFLQVVGIVTPETLRRNRRIALVAIVILGAVITPTSDPFNLAIVSIPMYVFFEISVVLGGRLTKGRLVNQ